MLQGRVAGSRYAVLSAVNEPLSSATCRVGMIKA